MDRSVTRANRALLRARLDTLARFRVDDWSVLAQATWTLLAVRAALRLVPFPRVLAWTARGGALRHADWTPARLDRMTWLVGLAGRLTRSKCLARSVVLVRLLAKRGIPAHVRIGVREESGSLEAHAWVESEGRTLDSIDTLQRFAPFDRPLGDVANV